MSRMVVEAMARRAPASDFDCCSTRYRLLFRTLTTGLLIAIYLASGSAARSAASPDLKPYAESLAAFYLGMKDELPMLQDKIAMDKYRTLKQYIQLLTTEWGYSLEAAAVHFEPKAIQQLNGQRYRLQADELLQLTIRTPTGVTDAKRFTGHTLVVVGLDSGLVVVEDNFANTDFSFSYSRGPYAAVPLCLLMYAVLSLALIFFLRNSWWRRSGTA